MELEFYCDGEGRHLVCIPYSIENLHKMAKILNIKRCWFHNAKNHPHYDIPKKRVNEIINKTNLVSSRRILEIIKNKS